MRHLQKGKGTDEMERQAEQSQAVEVPGARAGWSLTAWAAGNQGGPLRSKIHRQKQRHGKPVKRDVLPDTVVSIFSLITK